jgi:hypothetical protein
VTKKVELALAAGYGTRPGLLGVLMNSSRLPELGFSTTIVFAAGDSIGGAAFPGMALKATGVRSLPLMTRMKVDVL